MSKKHIIVLEVEFNGDRGTTVLTNENGDTYTSKSEELMDFLHTPTLHSTPFSPEDILAKHWENATGKPIDDTTKQHLSYVISAMKEAVKQQLAGQYLANEKLRFNYASMEMVFNEEIDAVIDALKQIVNASGQEPPSELKDKLSKDTHTAAIMKIIAEKTLKRLADDGAIKKSQENVKTIMGRIDRAVELLKDWMAGIPTFTATREFLGSFNK